MGLQPGGRVHNKYAEVPPRGPTRYPLWQRTYPFRMSSIEKWYTFHIHSIQLCIRLDYCRYTVLKTWINHKPERFFDFSTATKWIL